MSTPTAEPTTDPPSQVVQVDVGPLDPADVVAVARHGARVELTPAALAAITRSRAAVEALAASPVPVYGISTGFGALATHSIAPDQRALLQRSLVRSHAAGSGAPVEDEVVRAMALLRLSTLATGRTGVRPATAAAYAALLNAGLTPVVPEHGSLGCSGDLAPLSAIALAVMGEGEVHDGAGRRHTTVDAMTAAGLHPVTLAEKEGLALINGTDGMLGMLVLALADLAELVTLADVAAALSVEALRGNVDAFDAGLAALRPHPGQQASAANLRTLLAGTTLAAGGRRVQDAYSLRCHPQVAGAARDTFAHAALVAGRELASAIDNPVVTDEGQVASNGNFHGAPVAYVLDFASIAVADLASISERRSDRLLDAHRNDGLPAFLADDPGLDSGGMIAQYTAAGIVSDLKRLAVPASVDSIPSSAMQEDHVSMGWHAARKLRTAVDGLRQVVAIEAMLAARALDLRVSATGQPAAAGTGPVVAALRTVVAGPGPDRHLAPEIEATTLALRDGTLLAAARGAGALL